MTLWDDLYAKATKDHKAKTAEQLQAFLDGKPPGPTELYNALGVLIKKKHAAESAPLAVAVTARLVGNYANVVAEVGADGEIKVYPNGKPDAQAVKL